MSDFQILFHIVVVHFTFFRVVIQLFQNYYVLLWISIGSDFQGVYSIIKVLLMFNLIEPQVF